MTGRRIVVVGATGQIGRPLCAELLATGHAVSVFSRDPGRARKLVPGVADYVQWHPDRPLTQECGSQLAAADAVGIITFALQRPDLDRPANRTAPGAVRARRFARAFGNVLGHAAWLPARTPLVRMGLGAATDIIVGGKRMEPAKITAAGYQFRFPDVAPALRHIIDREPVP